MHHPIVTFTLIAATSICSIIGFRVPEICRRNMFGIREILAEKQFRRILTSAFFHADWMHLFLNMLSLYLFGTLIELYLGPGRFLLVYFAAVIGGSLLSLWIHRQHEYHAYGASGGVCGIIFSFVCLFPGASIGSFPLPLPIPAWLYAILFFIGSAIALRRQSDNIGHDAHLGGAVIGMWTTVALEPDVLRTNLTVVSSVSVLAVLLFVYLVWSPLWMPSKKLLPRRNQTPNARPASNPEAEMDAILEKIAKTGIESLTPREKSILKSVSEKYRRRAESQKPRSDLII